MRRPTYDAMKDRLADCSAAAAMYAKEFNQTREKLAASEAEVARLKRFVEGILGKDVRRTGDARDA